MSPSPRKLSSVDSPEGALRIGLEHLEEAYLECRDMRHRWYVSSDYRRVTTERDNVRPRLGHHDYVERRTTCERCGIERVEAFVLVRDRNWTALRSLGNVYHYPDGYLLKGLPAGIGNASELIRGLRFERAETERGEAAAPATRKRAARKTARSSA